MNTTLLGSSSGLMSSKRPILKNRFNRPQTGQTRNRRSLLSDESNRHGQTAMANGRPDTGKITSFNPDTAYADSIEPITSGTQTLEASQK